MTVPKFQRASKWIFFKDEIKVTDRKNFNLRRHKGISRNLKFSENKDLVEAPQSTYRGVWQSQKKKKVT